MKQPRAPDLRKSGLGCEKMAPMGDESRRLVRESYEAYNRADFDAVLETMTDDIVFEPGDDQAREELGGPYEGARAVREWFEAVAGQASGVRFEIKSLETPDRDTVIASIFIHGMLRDPAVAGALPVVQVISLRDGLIARNRYFRQMDESTGGSG